MDADNNQTERRVYHLSDADCEKIANRAKELALQELYITVGRSVVSKGLWFVGLVAASVAAYLGYQGYLNK